MCVYMCVWVCSLTGREYPKKNEDPSNDGGGKIKKFKKTFKEIIKKTNIFMLECWNAGVLQFRSAGVLESRHPGVQKCWNANAFGTGPGVLECWSAGTQTPLAQVLECWSRGIPESGSLEASGLFRIINF